MKFLKLPFTFIVFLFLFFSFSPLYSVTIYVDRAANQANNGTSWADAFTNLQSAINAAVYGDDIRVAEGNYYAPSTSFRLKDGVSIYGGYPSLSRGIAPSFILALRNTTNFPTILTRKKIGANDPIILIEDELRYNNSVGSTGNTLLDGVTIRGLNCVEINVNQRVNIYPLFRNCIFEGKGGANSKGHNGFQIRDATDSYVAPTFEGCEFKDFIYSCFKINKSIGTGYHIVAPRFDRTSFHDAGTGINIFDKPDFSLNGGFSIRVSKCSFYNLRSNSNNQTNTGAIFLQGQNSRINWIWVDNSLFYNNDRVFEGNVANLGSRVSTTAYEYSFSNCTFYKNNRHLAFAMYDKDLGISDTEQFPLLFLENCISWDNLNAAGKWIELDEGMHIELKSSLVEMTNANSSGQNTNSAVSLLNPHSTIHRIKADSHTIFAQNPNFINSSLSAIDLKLSSSSPAIDAGVWSSNVTYHKQKDYTNINDRIINNVLDMGAYEFCELGNGMCNNDTIDPSDGDYTMGKIAIKNNVIDKIVVYPNPATHQISLNTTAEIVKVELFNTKGQLLQTWDNQSQFNIQGLSKGLYILKVVTLNDTQSIRFIKE